MKRFILRCLAFTSIIIIFIGAFEYRLYTMPNTYSVKRQQFEANLDQWQTLTLGTSQSMYGIYPAVFGVPGYNLANNTQSLYYDQALLHKYIDRLPNLKIVIIPVSYFSLQISFPKTTEAWRIYFYERYFNIPLEPGSRLYAPERFSMIALYGTKNSWDYAAKLFNVDLSEGLTSTGNYFYSYDESMHKADITNGLTRVQQHNDMMYSELIPTNIEYLKQIITMTLDHGATPVLITLPVRYTYSNSVDPARYINMALTTKNLAEEYNIQYKNYFTDNRFTEDDFYDQDHLNIRGALYFSKILKTEVVDPILNSDNK